METANIGNYKASEDWYYLLPATLLVDVIVIFFTRYASSIAGVSLNNWYDNFGLAAVLSDVSIILIGIAIARYIYTYFFQEQEGWNIYYFIGVAVLVQILHDVFFAVAIVKPIPKGHNEMIDVFKAYISGGPKIIAADAGMIAASIGIASLLKNQDFHYTVSLSLMTVYTLSYILFTRPTN
jgi:hypothetical protein